MTKSSSPIVVALGGSIIVPSNINIPYLKRLRAFLLPYLSEGHKFVLVVGGGRVCRNYQQAALKVKEVSDEDNDWLGIHATRLNAHLLRTIFADVAYPVIFDDPHKEISDEDYKKYNLFIAAGGKPGHSTDYDAVELAHRFGADTFLVATTIPFVYDKDFKKYPDAKPLKETTWNEYRSLISDVWSPGMKSPVDPIAARYAQEYGMTCHLLRGTNIANFKKYLEGKSFTGSTIRP